MQLSESEFEEFKSEALDLIDHAEKALLALDAGHDFGAQYDSIFRSFHNLKGSAGMLELHVLQTHVHQMETTLVQNKASGHFNKELIDYFLKGCDRVRQLFESGFKSDEASIHETAPPLESATRVSSPPLALTKDVPSQSELKFLLSYLPELEDLYLARGEESKRTVLRQRIADLLRFKRSA